MTQRYSLRFRPWTLPRLPDESDDALSARREKAYFDWQLDFVNREFWKRLPHCDLNGRSVLDIGCGHGSLAFDVIARGAKCYHGVDTDVERISFAQSNVSTNFPALADRICFETKRAEQVDRSYDTIISKDSIEHIDNPQELVDAMYRLLIPDGVAIIGFGPLYYSPYGDHGRYTKVRAFPWLPVILPQKILFWIGSRITKSPITSLSDVGMNGITPARFRELFTPEKWEFLEIRYNCGGKPLLRVMSLLRRIPTLEKYFTVSIYAIIKRK